MYVTAAARRSGFVSSARTCFSHRAIASLSWTRPVNSCLHVEQNAQAAKVGCPGGTRTASADLTRHVACVHPDEPRHVHSRASGSVVSPASRQNRQRASSGAPLLTCETRASVRDCTSGFASRRARAIPAQSFLCPPEVQCAFWHGREQ